jgi:hypothetical protein
VYPRDYFETYWRTDQRDEIFVAMPFHAEFTPVWAQAIQPGIDNDSLTNLRAHRVDATTLSGSVITDILDGIAHSRLVLADVSVTRKGTWAGQRNGNVMYEVGLAHAIRHSTEIVLIRSDKEPLNFDIAQINANTYDRMDLDSTRKLIGRLVNEMMKQVKTEKSLKVQRALDQIDADMLVYLKQFAGGKPFYGPQPETRGDELSSIPRKAALSRLQQLGILRAAYIGDDRSPAFIITPFGKAVASALNTKEDSA